MSFFERIIHFDFWLFLKINGTWTNPFFDALFPLLRESIFWVPLYLFMLIFIWINFGVRGLFWSVALICTASLGDIISSHVIKENIFRLRPCRDPDLEGQVRILAKYCPRSSSFVSSHATNHFGLSMFIYMTLKQYFSRWIGLIFVWAAVIIYAQVYVGVHFPADVLTGSLVGCLIGMLMARFFNRYIGLYPKPLNRL